MRARHTPPLEALGLRHPMAGAPILPRRHATQCLAEPPSEPMAGGEAACRVIRPVHSPDRTAVSAAARQAEDSDQAVEDSVVGDFMAAGSMGAVSVVVVMAAITGDLRPQ